MSNNCGGIAAEHVSSAVFTSLHQICFSWQDHVEVTTDYITGCSNFLYVWFASGTGNQLTPQEQATNAKIFNCKHFALVRIWDHFVRGHFDRDHFSWGLFLPDPWTDVQRYVKSLSLPLVFIGDHGSSQCPWAASLPRCFYSRHTLV